MTIFCHNSCAEADRYSGPRGGLLLFTKIGILFVLLLASIALSCMNVHVRIGNRPQTDLLETTLRLGESTRTDVLSVLGEPFGRGQTMLPVEPKPREMWSYYYEEGDSKDSRRIFLFVYFDQDLYDGYMWFSSLL